MNVQFLQKQGQLVDEKTFNEQLKNAFDDATLVNRVDQIATLLQIDKNKARELQETFAARDTLDDTTMLDRVTGKAQYHVDVATALWKDHKLFGCGGWGYAHLCVPKMQELEIDTKGLQTVGGAYVHNDHLQFLVEHGLVGYGCLVAIVVLLVWPVVRQWRDMVRDLRFKKAKELPPRPIAIFALPAPVFFILMTFLATFIHAFGDCPLRSCAVLDLFFISLAALPGFMPKPVAREYHHHHH